MTALVRHTRGINLNEGELNLREKECKNKFEEVFAFSEIKKGEERERELKRMGVQEEKERFRATRRLV